MSAQHIQGLNPAKGPPTPARIGPSEAPGNSGYRERSAYLVQEYERAAASTAKVHRELRDIAKKIMLLLKDKPTSAIAKETGMHIERSVCKS